eukprot:6710066-Prymnesium_polylepis.3
MDGIYRLMQKGVAIGRAQHTCVRPTCCLITHIIRSLVRAVCYARDTNTGTAEIERRCVPVLRESLSAENWRDSYISTRKKARLGQHHMVRAMSQPAAACPGVPHVATRA